MTKLTATGDHFENHQRKMTGRENGAGGGDADAESDADYDNGTVGGNGALSKPKKRKKKKYSVLQAKLTRLASLIGQMGM